MSEQHPTIPGVKVEFGEENGNPMRTLFFETICEDEPDPIVVEVIAVYESDGGAVWPDYSNAGYTPDECETVAAMILDQVAWLKQQEASDA